MTKSTNNYTQHTGTGGFWFLGFVATLAYYLHYHSGSLWLVILAFIKAIFWLPVLVYYVFQFMKV
jgi:uncharacterized membrane protein